MLVVFADRTFLLPVAVASQESPYIVKNLYKSGSVRQKKKRLPLCAALTMNYSTESIVTVCSFFVIVSSLTAVRSSIVRQSFKVSIRRYLKIVYSGVVKQWTNREEWTMIEKYLEGEGR